MQCNGSCCCYSPVYCFPRGRRLAGAEVEGRGPHGQCHCAMSTVHTCCCWLYNKITTILFLLQVFLFFPRFVVALNRFSAIQNYSRMKIKNMFFGKFNTRVDSARQAGDIHCHSFSYSFIALTCSLTHYSIIHLFTAANCLQKLC